MRFRFLEKIIHRYRPSFKEKTIKTLEYIYTYRKYVLIAWILIIIVAAILFVIHRNTFVASVKNFFEIYPFIGYSVFFLMMVIRGLTFIPLDAVVIAFIPFTHPYTLFVLTIIGTCISSVIIYYFASYLTLGDHFERKYPKTIGRLHKRFERHELGTVIARSFLPFTPTDIVCYIAGVLKVDVKKMLIGVAIGSSIICGVYIFGGEAILHTLL